MRLRAAMGALAETAASAAAVVVVVNR
jgi:hypothetical protein